MEFKNHVNNEKIRKKIININIKKNNIYNFVSKKLVNILSHENYRLFIKHNEYFKNVILSLLDKYNLYKNKNIYLFYNELLNKFDSFYNLPYTTFKTYKTYRLD